MLKGKSTNESYDKCLKSGLCEQHLAELKVTDATQRHEKQRKAILFIRLQILGPILFDKPYSSEKMKKLFTLSGYFTLKNASEQNYEEFIDSVLVLDSVMVFTLCKFCSICCAGAFFRPEPMAVDSSSSDNFFLKLLRQKKLGEKDISNFNPFLEENFSGFDEALVKIGYVATLLYVRNVSMHIKFKKALEQLELEIQSSSKEGEQWRQIGLQACTRDNWDEAIDAFSKSLNYNPYSLIYLINRAHSYMQSNKSKEAILDCYVALMISPTHIAAFCKWATSLYVQSQFADCIAIAESGLEMCRNSAICDPKKYKALEKIKIEADNAINMEKVASKLQELDVPEKKDLPELIEASDSDTESQDVPDLMEASNSEDSDSEPEESNSDMQCEPSTSCESSVDHPVSKESKTEESGLERKNSDEPTKLKNEVQERTENFQITLKEASKTLLDGCGLMAIRRFRDALDEIKAYPQIHNYEECDIICIKYAYAFACYKSGGYDDLQKAITVCKDIIEDYKTTTFPAAHFCIGLAYHKLNRFKDSLHYLRLVESIVEKGIHCKVYAWPGLTTVIDETKLEHLKNLLPDLIKECENPPPPNATCRFENCTLQPSIYYSDPDFKGFYAIECSEHCCLQYHPQCWKSIKTSMNYTDKAFLEQKCYTPDCEGFITKIQIITKDGNIGKEFSVADVKKSAKLKKSKLEKRLEIKEEKKRKRRDSTRTDSTSEIPEEITNESLPEPEIDNSTKELNAKELKSTSKLELKETNENLNASNTSQLSVNAEPFIIFKKEKFINENANKIATKLKEHKKIKSNTYSIDEFLQQSDVPSYSNEYQQRLNSLRLSNQNTVEGIWSTSNIKLPNVPLTAAHTLDDFQSVTSIQPQTTKSSEFPKLFVNLTECIKKSIYSYFKEILGKYGPMRVDDPNLLKKINSFPEEANLIAEYDGIGKFLQQNVDFAFVGETYVCLVEQLPLAYRKMNNANLPDQDLDVNLPSSFQTLDVNEEKSTELFRFSYLNPAAQEYTPETSSNTSLKDCSVESKLDCGPVKLISAISKLRQPLSVDQESVSPRSIGSLVNVDTFQQQNNDIADHSRRSSLSSTNSCSQKSIVVDPQIEIKELIQKCKEAIKLYFSEEVKQHRQFLDVCLKPYSIIQLSSKSNQYIQTENDEVEDSSDSTELELLTLQEMINNLTEEKKLLEEKCHSALDSATRSYKKSSVEIANLKKELEDANAALEEQKKDFKNKESKLEKEMKTLSESLKKAKDENLALKTERDKLLASQERESLDSEEKLKDCIKNLEREKLETQMRAKEAELLLLKLKKTEFLKRIGIKKGEANQQIKQYQDGLKMFHVSLNPVVLKTVQELLARIQNYILELDHIQRDFITRIDEQINEVNNGSSLASLRPLEVKDLPEIPSLNPQATSNLMVNTQATANWASQMFGSTFNGGGFNPLSYPSVTTLQMPAKTNVPDSKQNHQNPVPETSAPSPCHSSCNDVSSEINKQSVSLAPKIPPGLQSKQELATVSHITASSMKNLDVVGHKQQLSEQTKLQSDKLSSASGLNVSNLNVEKIKAAGITNGGLSKLTSDKLSSASGLNVSNSKIEQIKAVAAAITNVKQPTENPSSIELGYNIRKSDSVENASSAATANFASTAQKAAIPAVKSNSDKNTKRNFEKLLCKLQEKYPKYSEPELAAFVKEFRDRRQKGLSGLTLENIIISVSEIIDLKMKASNQVQKVTASGPKTQSATPVLVNKKLVSCDAKPKVCPQENPAPKKSAWGNSEGDTTNKWSGSADDSCIICYEEMTFRNTYKVDCGHSFHLKCIREWLNKKSDCPICRVHLLLPEDYPALM